MTLTDPEREELIARLEKEGPSRELDITIAQATDANGYRIEDDGTILVSGDMGDGPGWFNIGYDVPAYTTSIDAALTLVPDEHTWNAGITDEHYGGPLIATAQVLTREHTPEGWRARGVNPAIALCAAALRARSP